MEKTKTAIEVLIELSNETDVGKQYLESLKEHYLVSVTESVMKKHAEYYHQQKLKQMIPSDEEIKELILAQESPDDNEAMSERQAYMLGLNAGGMFKGAIWLKNKLLNE